MSGPVYTAANYKVAYLSTAEGKKYPIRLKSPLTMQITGSFAPLLGDIQTPPFMNFLSSSISIAGQALPSGASPILTFQFWNSTSPITFNINGIYYNDGSNSLENLVHLLGQAVLPIQKSVQDKNYIGGIAPPGPNFSDIASYLGDASVLGKIVETVSNFIVKASNPEGKTWALSQQPGRLQNLVLGGFSIPQILVTNYNVSYSKDFMKQTNSNSLVPLYADISITCSTPAMATTRVLEKIKNITDGQDTVTMEQYDDNPKTDSEKQKDEQAALRGRVATPFLFIGQ